MKYPKLAEIPAPRELIDVFKGYNHNLRIGDGEFFDMTNLSSDCYPMLSPRGKRGIYAVPMNPQGMIAKDKLCYVDGEYLVIGTDKYNLGLDVNTPKTLVSMGAYIIIFPDKLYINTLAPSDRGFLENTFTRNSGKIPIRICDQNGNDYSEVSVGYGDRSDEINEDDASVATFAAINISKTPYTIQSYDALSKKWIAVDGYVWLHSDGIGEGFSVGDWVRVGDIRPDPESPPERGKLEVLEGLAPIVGCGANDLVIKSLCVPGVVTSLTIKREVPDMQYVVESNNRLWGCYSGNKDGVYINEIYASALGDFRNWNSFQGVSTDSYTASVGTDGAFTGAITHLGYPLFFKENFLHKVYGNFPSNYQIQTTACRGVQQGCSRSLAIVNEVLYYKARSGVCAYDGSLPAEISYALGDVRYGNAVAGALGNKYYISMSDDADKYHLFVYDALKGMWHREDDTQATQFCNFQGNLYYIDYGYKQIRTVKETGINAKETKPIKWEAVTGIIGVDSPDKKYLSRMDVRMSLEVGARVSFFAEYDSSGEWEHLFTMDGVTLSSFAVPIKPQRCDHMRLKIIGVGDAKMFSICKTIEQGSDI